MRDLLSRSGNTFKTPMQLYRASIYDTIGGSTNDSSRDEDGGDDRYQVRILPNMMAISGEQLKYLPRFPLLFRTTRPSFKTEKKDGKEADIVIVLATANFSMGYIVGGPISKWTGTRSQDMQPNSWQFKQFLEIVKERERSDARVSENFKYGDLTVDAWGSGNGQTSNGNSTGGNIQAGYVICHNEKTGEMYWINGSGTMMALGSGYFSVNVGGKGQAGNGSSYSEILVTPGKVSIVTDEFAVDAKRRTKLGCSGMMLVGTNSALPSNGNGMPLIPLNTATA